MKRPSPCTSRRRRESGAALLIVSLILVLVTLLAFTALRHSENESAAGARSRSSTRTVQAADGGIQLALSRLAETPPNLTAFDVDLVDGANVQSRTRVESTPQTLDQVGTGTTKEGYSVNVGSGMTYMNRIYLVTVTATAGGSTAEVEAKLGRTGAEPSGY